MSDTLHPGRWWHPLDDQGQVQCDLCPRYCRPRPGQRGLCYVRMNHEGRMVLTTYGRSSGFCVDPIEKKPLNHFLPGTSVLSFGTAGCNLGCRFCQNWDISKARSHDRLADQASPAAIAARARELGCRSVAFTYNDPVIFAEYAIDVAAACREVDVRAVAVTAGYIAAGARPEFYAGMDAANVDLKGFTPEFYRKVCLGELEPVLETLVYLRRETAVWLELTTLVIPGHNDSTEELARQADWIVEHLGPDVPLHFSAFHPDFKMLDVPRTPPETLRRARDVARAAGLAHVYTGNVHDAEGGSTYCHACGERLIERDWYELGEWRLDAEGRCAACRSPLAGVLEARPGRWGRRRLPVSIARGGPATA
ncbi:MAG: AmmeMemoRadiSam system radical SAM enzyme [Planctomycetes bacterium]|nr:AmmeMemoRadiSam system radical SAM enzyme [Planctomycetota bacterium]